MHRATDRFWRCYHNLPSNVRKDADKAFALLRDNPRHPSLFLKKVGALWSVRVSDACRALAVRDGDDFLWVWIGMHDEYDLIIRNRR